jgi:hypothetical protein
MEKFTRSDVRTLHDDIVDALSVVAKKHDIVINYKGASFTSDKINVKLEVCAIKDGKAFDQSREDFTRLASLYSLIPDMLDTTFVHLGKTFKITGLSPRKPKFPVLVIDVTTGKKYKFPVLTVKSALQLK